MRVIIAGGREFNDYPMLKAKCDEVLSGISGIEVVSGGARGTDRLGERYAKEKGYPTKIFLADWIAFGKPAGHIRNREMGDYAKEDDGMLILFWDGKSTGSGGMLGYAEKIGLETHVFKF